VHTHIDAALETHMHTGTKRRCSRHRSNTVHMYSVQISGTWSAGVLDRRGSACASSAGVDRWVFSRVRMAFDHVAWLGGDRGGEVLSATLQSWLLKGFEDGIWDEKDVPKDDVVLPKKRAEMWADILDDCASLASAKVGKVVQRRLMNWLDPVSSCVDEMVDVPASYVPSKQCREDMSSQGATSHYDLIFSELSLVSGRPASRAELEGGIYAGPASLTVGGKLLIKSKEKTFDSELQLAIAAGHTGILDSWITRLAGLCTDSDYPYAPIFASNLLKFWMKAKQNLKDETLVLAYMREQRGDKVGRGFPSAYDGELADRARAMDKRPTASQNGSAALSMAAASQMDEILKAVQAVTSKLSSMEGKMSTVQQKVSGLEAKVGSGVTGTPVGTKQKTCLACGAEGHSLKECKDVPADFEPPSWYQSRGK
jgi:hypothetical protein